MNSIVKSKNLLFQLMKRLWGVFLWMLVTGLGLQLYFFTAILAMSVLPATSTSFQRSQLWQLAWSPKATWQWRQHWLSQDEIPASINLAVIAAEDAGFASHMGVEWESIEQAMKRNEKALSRFEQQKTKRLRIVGGSTITQQLAKNLFLSPERTMLRKGQELVITAMLELLLGKRRILQTYVNSVEWGAGIFGIQAAAVSYFNKPAINLRAIEAAKLAAMLPRPKYYEKRFQQAYLNSRAQTISLRMQQVELPQ